MAKEEHNWGRERRRDGNSEWPSTSFSTMSGALQEPRPVRARRRGRPVYAGLLLPFLLILVISAACVLGIARHLHG